MEGRSSVILIPACGESRRFAEEGWSGPKALLPVTLGGVRRTMLEHLLSEVPHWLHPMLIVRDHHAEAFRQVLGSLQPSSTVLSLSRPTRGQSETILQALQGMITDRPVMVQNCDVLVRHRVLQSMARSGSSAVLLHQDRRPASERAIYSYVDNPSRPRVYAEKQRITDWAQTGLWSFSSAHRLMAAIHSQLQSQQIGEVYLSGALSQPAAPQMIGVIAGPDDWLDLGTPAMIEASGAVLG